ncbi:MAG: cytochrome c3 family protein [Acidobacteria bacterium]|nr:cytochrome c3 family protein [Acidobacteriota bacterium]
MRRWLLFMFTGLVFAPTVMLWAQYTPRDEKLPGEPVKQPLPYSHKVHVGLGLKCLDCHKIEKPGYMAGYPQEATCMACHASIKADSPHIQKLAEIEKSGTRVPWVKLYAVPNYVYFSHEAHHKEAKIECVECHGDVAQRDVLFKEKSTAMTTCMDCHAQRQASNNCGFCHDPHPE